jgi:hypothetical protein
MKQVSLKTVLWFALMIFFSLKGIAQNFSAAAYIGSCYLRYIKPDDLLYPGSSYSPGYSYKAGIYYDFYRKHTKFFTSAGVSITAKNAINSGSNRLTTIQLNQITRDKFQTFDLPVYLNYRFKQRIIFKAGASSSILLAHSHHGPTETKLVTFGLLGGATLWIKRYSFNFECIYDLNSMLKGVIVDTYYKNTLIHVGVGYHF